MGRAGNEEGGTEKEGEEEESRGGRDGEEDREREGAGEGVADARRGHWAHGSDGSQTLRYHCSASWGRSERWREGEGSLTECRYRALCFEQPGHGAKEALVLPFSGTMIVNPINYLLSFQCVRLHAKPFK